MILVFSISCNKTRKRKKCIFISNFSPIFRTLYSAKLPEERRNNLLSKMKYCNKDKDDDGGNGMVLLCYGI